MYRSRGLSYLCLILSIIAVMLVYLLLPYGVNSCDEPFLILETLNNTTANLTPLSFITSKAMASMFGHQWIAYRGLSVTIFMLAILIASGYYYFRTRHLSESLLIFGSLTLLFALKKDNWCSLYGYDCYSMCFTTIYAIVILEYIRRRSYFTVLVLALVSALNVLFRFPNVTCIPLAVLIILILPIFDGRDRYRLSILQTIVYIAAILAVMFVICTFIYGSIGDYILLLVNIDVKGHGLGTIIVGYVYHLFINIIPYISYIVSIYLMYYVISKQQGTRSGVKCLIALGIFIFCVAELVVLWRLLFIQKQLLFVAFCMSFMLYAVSQKQATVHMYLSCAFLFLCGFITTLGSDGGLTKYMFFSMIPLLLVFIGQPKRPFIFTSFTVYISLLIIGTASICKSTFVDDGIFALNSEIHHPKTLGLLTSQTQAASINQAMGDFGPYVAMDSVETTVVGNDRTKYIYDYIFDRQNMHLKNVWDNFDYYNDESVVASIMKDIQASSRPYYVLMLKNGDDSKMLKTAKENLMLIKETDTYFIFSSPQVN